MILYKLECKLSFLILPPGDEPIDVGDKVVVSASREELEELQTRRGLWESDQCDVCMVIKFCF